MRRILAENPQYLVVAGLFLLVLSVYGQVGRFPFIILDDLQYVTENPAVLQGFSRESVSWAFTTFHAANWHPLTWLSHMADVELFGPSARWHHRMNVAYHLLNTGLLFLVLWRMTGGLWKSAFVAALFGVHPLHVESVAWVSERKDVLSTLFLILTMGAYLRYVRSPGLGRYLVVAACFALGLMCKPMLVTLPFALLLLDWWPLGRMAPSDAPWWRPSMPALRGLVREKLPLLGLSAISCAVTLLAQAGGGAVKSFTAYSPGSRLANALVSYVSYLGKTAWPLDLAVFYPHPAMLPGGIPAWKIAGSILLLAGISFLAFWQGRCRPYLAVGWLWYLGTLLPVIGLAQVGEAGMADRYTYVPLIGIFLMVVWGVPDLLEGWRFRRIALGALCGSVVLAFTMAARHQAGYWRDSVTLFSRALAITETNWFVSNNLGASYDRLGRIREAIPHYREALRIKPDFAEGWNNLGLAYGKIGQPREAIAYYREALRIKPGNAETWNNLGVAYGKLGEYPQAVEASTEAVRLRPDYAMAWYNLGITYKFQNEKEKIQEVYRQIRKYDPDLAERFFRETRDAPVP